MADAHVVVLGINWSTEAAFAPPNQHTCRRTTPASGTEMSSWYATYRFPLAYELDACGD